MDACFGQILNGAVQELGDVEDDFYRSMSKGYMRPKSLPKGHGAHGGRGMKRSRPGKIHLPVSASAGLPGAHPKLAAAGAAEIRRRREANVAWESSPNTEPMAEFWGTPIHFAPNQSGTTAARGSSVESPEGVSGALPVQSRTSDERNKLLSISYAGARRANQERLAREAEVMVERMSVVEEREQDYEVFVILSERFGSMPPMSFCASSRPGRTYECILYKLACRIELWVKIWVPRRKAMKQEATVEIQRM